MRRITTIAALLAVLAAVLVAAGCGAGRAGGRDARDGDRRGPEAGRTVQDIPALKLTGDAAAGKAVVPSGCAGCHTLARRGRDTGPSARISTTSKPALELVVQRVALGQGGMPAFSKAKGGQLDDQQIADVAAYVVQATGG